MMDIFKEGYDDKCWLRYPAPPMATAGVFLPSGRFVVGKDRLQLTHKHKLPYL